METIKIGIIGCGRISKNHFDAVSQIQEAEFVAACDVIDSRLQTVSDNYGIKKLYTNYKEMMEKENLDLVSICTPRCLHP